MTIVLSRALVLLALDYERESPLSLPMSADILPAIGADKVRLRDLPLRAGVSKEAVSAATGFPRADRIRCSQSWPGGRPHRARSRCPERT